MSDAGCYYDPITGLYVGYKPRVFTDAERSGPISGRQTISVPKVSSTNPLVESEIIIIDGIKYSYNKVNNEWSTVSSGNNMILAQLKEFENIAAHNKAAKEAAEAINAAKAAEAKAIDAVEAFKAAKAEEIKQAIAAVEALKIAEKADAIEAIKIANMASAPAFSVPSAFAPAPAFSDPVFGPAFSIPSAFAPAPAFASPAPAFASPAPAFVPPTTHVPIVTRSHAAEAFINAFDKRRPFVPAPRLRSTYINPDMPSYYEYKSDDMDAKSFYDKFYIHDPMIGAPRDNDSFKDIFDDFQKNGPFRSLKKINHDYNIGYFSLYETSENNGKFIVLNVSNGAYFMNDLRISKNFTNNLYVLKTTIHRILHYKVDSNRLYSISM
jgi:hypothetical protein